MASEPEVRVRLLPRRVLWRGGEVHYPLEVVTVPLSEARILLERGTVFPFDAPSDGASTKARTAKKSR